MAISHRRPFKQVFELLVAKL
jgi:hypothetical protein